MATFSFISTLPANVGTNSNTIYAANLAAAASSPEIVVGRRVLFRIATEGEISVRWGQLGQVVAPGATDMLIFAGTTEVLDMGENDSIMITSNSGGAISITHITKS